MRSRWRLTTTTAVMVSGLLALHGAAPAFAQSPPAKPATKAPAKGAPAAPKPLTEKQKKDAARKAYKEGEANFKDGKYQEALEAYKVADDLLPVPASKFKIAVCRDKLGEVVDAVGAYQTFLDTAPPPDKYADSIVEAKARVELLKKTPGKILIAVIPPDAPKLAFTIDGGPPQPAASLPTEVVSPGGGAPLKHAAIAVAPGRHRLAVQAEGFDPGATELEVPFAQSKDIRVTLSPTPPPPPPPPPPRSNVPAYVTLGLAGAGVVVGTIFGVAALKSKDAFNAKNGATTDNADTTDRNALISDMSFAVALTFGVTGVVLLLSNDSAEPAKTGAHQPTKKSAVRGFVTPYAGPSGGGAVGVFTF